MNTCGYKYTRFTVIAKIFVFPQKSLKFAGISYLLRYLNDLWAHLLILILAFVVILTHM